MSGHLRYSPELRERAVKMVSESRQGYGQQHGDNAVSNYQKAQANHPGFELRFGDPGRFISRVYP
jgi:transposase-like protein